MFRFAIKIAAVVFTIVLLFLSGYYIYLTRDTSDSSQAMQTEGATVENDILRDHGVEVSEDVDQMFGTYEMYDGNRIYIKLSETQKNWVFVKPEFNLYCTDAIITKDTKFSSKYEQKSSLTIEELMEQGDDVLVGFVMDGGEKYLAKILTDSPTACGGQVRGEQVLPTESQDPQIQTSQSE